MQYLISSRNWEINTECLLDCVRWLQLTEKKEFPSQKAPAAPSGLRISLENCEQMRKVRQGQIVGEASDLGGAVVVGLLLANCVCTCEVFAPGFLFTLVRPYLKVGMNQQCNEANRTLMPCTGASVCNCLEPFYECLSTSILFFSFSACLMKFPLILISLLKPLQTNIQQQICSLNAESVH